MKVLEEIRRVATQNIQEQAVDTCTQNVPKHWLLLSFKCFGGYVFSLTTYYLYNNGELRIQHNYTIRAL